MNEIICPNCKKAFKVDEASFVDGPFKVSHEKLKILSC